jgi:hypothetical protein
MATEKIASKEAVEKALNSIGYSSVVNTDKPYYEIASNKYFTIYIEDAGGDSPRRKFLEKLSETLNTKKYGFSSTYNPVRSATPKSSIGKIEFNKSTIAIICKYYPEIGLKPSNISPTIVDKYMKPEEMIKNVTTYINKVGMNGPQKKQIIDFMEKSLNPRTYSFEVDGAVSDILVPAEFMEVLSAIKMAALLRVNDLKIRKVLRVPPKLKFSQSSPIKIFIPEASNFPLIDYQISFLPDDNETTFKVSVKSKVKGDNTNTVKFSQIFENTTAVGFWYRHLNSSIKSENFGPAQVAFSALRYYGQSKEGKKGKAATRKSPAIAPIAAERYAGKVKVGFPINAVGHIMEINSLGLNQVIMEKSFVSDGKTKRKPTNAETKAFGIMCRKISRNISNIDTKSNLGDLFKTASEKKLIPIVINLISTNNEVQGKPAEPTLINLGKYCEKILEWSSKKTSKTKFNFFQMFYDKVLKEKSVAYAVTDSSTTRGKDNKKTTIIFKYLSAVNWVEEYHNWIGLRKKDGDALGLDL